MIKYALLCAEDHPFEAWFPNSDGYDDQVARGLVSCPYCGTTDVRKQIMAPAIGGRARQGPTADEMAAFATKVRDHIAETHVYVGDRFADEARAMHYGEKDHAPIYGKTTPDEAKALKEEGVPAAPLPPAFTPTPPDEAKKLN